MLISHAELKKMKAKLSRRQRTFTGEDLGTWVIQYLGRTDRLRDDPIEKLVELINRAHRSEDVRTEIEQLVTETNKAWNFRMVYETSRASGGGVTVALKGVADRPNSPAFNRALPEWNRCMVLLEQGLLDRLRYCAHCNKLFYARFAHSEYHDDSCRVAVEVANPIYRERRAAYMRQQREKARKGGKKP
jgi:hypothetical protein